MILVNVLGAGSSEGVRRIPILAVIPPAGRLRHMITPRKKPKSGALDVVLGQRIRRIRRERGLSQSALAAQVGMTFQQVQKYENGANRVSALTLVKVAEALGVNPTSLLEDLDETAKRPPVAAEADQLAADFARIASPEMRSAVLAIVAGLAN
jgi:transcriptional regulator with XRE-family HTH domain